MVLTRGTVDLVLLDLGLPDADGFDFARQLRQQAITPIIMVTSRSAATEVAAGLELGADDYVTKPFFPRELVARVNNVLRRAKGVPGERLLFRGYSLDTSTRILSHGHEQIALTRGEFDLLAALAKARGRVYSRDALLDLVTRRHETSTERTVDVLISRLRRKLTHPEGAPPILETIHGIGYRLNP